MQEKKIHIVFQVLNFLYSDECKKHKLLPIDKLILITLAHHKGAKGIFPMQETLAQELNTSLRYIKTRLKHLHKIGFISVQKSHRKNFYALPFTDASGDLQITYSDVDNLSSGDLQITSQVIHRSPHRGSTDATINKVNNKLSNRERAHNKRALPLHVNFTVNNEGQNLCKERNLDVAIMQKKFILISQANGKRYADPDAAFELFVMNEKAGVDKPTRNNVVALRVVPDDEDYKPCSGCQRPMLHCTCRLTTSKAAAEFIKKIREKCKI